MQHEAWFFIGLFVFIFVVWIALGGPARPPAVNVPRFSSSSEAATATPSMWSGSSIALPHAPFAVGTTRTGFGGSAPSEAPPLVEVPGVIFTPSSPYRGLVSMNSYVGNASSSDAREEYVQISVAQSAHGPINITGWVLRSGATGRYAYIPRGTALPTSGVVNPVADITLTPGERAYLISGTSPVGASFRENKCIGYFEAYQDFAPTLPQQCPSGGDELASLYGTPYIHDPKCIDYAETVPRCRVPVPPASADLSLTCEEFFEARLNYNGCVEAHGGDADFAGDTWRIYLGRKNDKPFLREDTAAYGPLWRDRHEVVELIDKKGYTVDAFAY